VTPLKRCHPIAKANRWERLSAAIYNASGSFSAQSRQDAAPTGAQSRQDDSYAFIFSQQGLMAGVSIEGTKISRIKR